MRGLEVDPDRVALGPAVADGLGIDARHALRDMNRIGIELPRVIIVDPVADRGAFAGTRDSKLVADSDGAGSSRDR